jgi:DNA-binding GntR family transcriptional regulator
MTKALQMVSQPTRKARSTTPLQLVPVVRADTLGDQAYGRIREAIASGAIPPGQRLTVRGLVEALGIGFTPAREALNRLAAEGILAVGPNRTLAVPELTLAKYEEIVAIRCELEPMAATAALPHVQPADLRALEAIQERLLAAMSRRDYVTVLGCNRDFHFTLYRLSGMSTLVGLIDGLWLQVGPTLRHLYPGYARNWKGGVNHAAILKSLHARDAARLVAAIRKDLDDGRAPISAVLAQAAPPELLPSAKRRLANMKSEK